MNKPNPNTVSAFKSIRAIDYTVIFVRDMAAMRRFYEDVIGLALQRELSPNWLEYQLGGNTLALARPSLTASDAPTPVGSAALQTWRSRSSAADVDACADELVRAGVRWCRRRRTGRSAIARCSFAIRMGICWKYTRRSSRPSLRARRVGKAQRAHHCHWRKNMVGTAQERLCPPYGDLNLPCCASPRDDGLRHLYPRSSHHGK